jgi:hypothetical protein
MEYMLNTMERVSAGLLAERASGEDFEVVNVSEERRRSRAGSSGSRSEGSDVQDPRCSDDRPDIVIMGNGVIAPTKIEGSTSSLGENDHRHFGSADDRHITQPTVPCGGGGGGGGSRAAALVPILRNLAGNTAQFICETLRLSTGGPARRTQSAANDGRGRASERRNIQGPRASGHANGTSNSNADMSSIIVPRARQPSHTSQTQNPAIRIGRSNEPRVGRQESNRPDIHRWVRQEGEDLISYIDDDHRPSPSTLHHSRPISALFGNSQNADGFAPSLHANQTADQLGLHLNSGGPVGYDSRVYSGMTHGLRGQREENSHLQQPQRPRHSELPSYEPPWQGRFRHGRPYQAFVMTGSSSSDTTIP